MAAEPRELRAEDTEALPGSRVECWPGQRRVRAPEHPSSAQMPRAASRRPAAAPGQVAAASRPLLLLPLLACCVGTCLGKRAPRACRAPSILPPHAGRFSNLLSPTPPPPRHLPRPLPSLSRLFRWFLVLSFPSCCGAPQLLAFDDPRASLSERAASGAGASGPARALSLQGRNPQAPGGLGLAETCGAPWHSGRPWPVAGEN